jgi:uncharacterized protein (DUF983 family)
MKAAFSPEAAPARWVPGRAIARSLPWPLPSMGTALARGFANRCPACGKTHLFVGYLRVTPECSACGAPLGLVRADDAPPYFTIVVVGHVIVPAMLYVEKTYEPPLWVHAAIWLPLTLAMSLLILRPIKGATVGLMLKLGLLKSETDE